MLGTESLFTTGGFAQTFLPFAALLLMCPDLCAMGQQHAALESHLDGSFILCASADFDGDQRIDLVSATLSPEQSPDRGETFTLAFHPANAAAWPALAHSPWLVQHLQASDVDGDRDTDLVLENASEQPLAVWLNDGKGHFERGDVNDYPELRLQRDPKDVTASGPRASREQASEDAGSHALALGAMNFEPTFAAVWFYIGQEASAALLRPPTSGARGPPASR